MQTHVTAIRFFIVLSLFISVRYNELTNKQNDQYYLCDIIIVFI